MVIATPFKVSLNFLSLYIFTEPLVVVPDKIYSTSATVEVMVTSPFAWVMVTPFAASGLVIVVVVPKAIETADEKAEFAKRSSVLAPVPVLPSAVAEEVVVPSMVTVLPVVDPPGVTASSSSFEHDAIVTAKRQLKAYMPILVTFADKNPTGETGLGNFKKGVVIFGL